MRYEVFFFFVLKWLCVVHCFAYKNPNLEEDYENSIFKIWTEFLIALVKALVGIVRSRTKATELVKTPYSNIYPTRCNVTPFILSGNCSTYFGWYLHPSSGAQTTVSTASGICHAFIAICRYRGRDGTGLSVLCVAYATHSTLKPDTYNGRLSWRRY